MQWYIKKFGSFGYEPCMDFNFYNQYKDYSNFELLKILQQQDHYQPAAVEAATLILKEREVSEEEKVEAHNHFDALQQKEQLKKEGIYKIQEKLFDFFEPIIRPGNEFHPVKWLNMLIAFIAVAFAWSFGVKLWFLGRMLTYGYFDFSMVIDAVYLIYMPLLLYLLIKKKRWGWILLVAESCLIIIFAFPESYYLFRHVVNPVMYFFVLAFRCFLLYFLWRPKISELFGVTARTKKDTALVMLLWAPVLLVLMYMVSN
jgi:hypothetical protein